MGDSAHPTFVWLLHCLFVCLLVHSLSIRWETTCTWHLFGYFYCLFVSLLLHSLSLRCETTRTRTSQVWKKRTQLLFKRAWLGVALCMRLDRPAGPDSEAAYGGDWLLLRRWAGMESLPWLVSCKPKPWTQVCLVAQKWLVHDETEFVWLSRWIDCWNEIDIPVVFGY
jgi:hypothetical protein